METKLKERNQDKEIRRKQDKKRGITEPRKLVKEIKINKKIKAVRKGKIRNFKQKILKTCKESDTKSYSANQTHYEQIHI